MPRAKKPQSPFRYFNSSPGIIRLVVMMYVRFPLSLRNVEDLLAERGIDICHETVRHWWNRFGPMFAADVRRQRVSRMRGFRQWKWHLDEVYVKINGEMHYLWRAVEQEGEALESYVTKARDKKAALRFMRRRSSAMARRLRSPPMSRARIEQSAGQKSFRGALLACRPVPSGLTIEPLLHLAKQLLRDDCLMAAFVDDILLLDAGQDRSGCAACGTGHRG